MSKRLCIDLFCGMGGWSVGFYRQGYSCVGVDRVDVGYPYELQLSDVADYHPGLNPDALVMSPPCTEFSSMTRIAASKGQRGMADPEGEGMRLVNEAIRVRDEAKPRFWVLENVVGSIPYISKVLGPPMLVARPWVLWGNLPPSLMTFEPSKKTLQKRSECEQRQGIRYWRLAEDFAFDPLSSWKRARIPVFIAQEIARRIDSQIDEAAPGWRTQGLWCDKHDRPGNEFRRNARDVFGWSLRDKVVQA